MAPPYMLGDLGPLLGIDLRVPWIDVRDERFFGGAVGDGVTDDTAAFQAAITAAPVGATVLVPGYGTNYLVGSLTPKSGVHLVGVGLPTLTHKSGEQNAIFYWPQTPRTLLSNVTIRGMKFVGDLAATVENQRSAVMFHYCDNIRVVDCEIQDFATSGIYLADVMRYWVLDNKLTGNCHHSSRNSLNIVGKDDSFTVPIPALANGYGYIRGNYVDHSATSGAPLAVVMQGTDTDARAIITNNITRGGTGFAGIVAEGGTGSHVAIANNQVYGALNGIEFAVTGNDHGAEQQRHNVISGNIVDSEAVAAGLGILVSGTPVNVAITGNSVRSTSTCLQVAGSASGNGKNISITGNTLLQENTAAALLNWMVLSKIDGLTVSGNTFRRGTSATGGADQISVQGGVDRFAITGNVLNQPSRYGIRLTTAASSNGLIANNTIIDANESNVGNTGAVVIDAVCDRISVRGNLIRDARGTARQTFGVWMNAAATNVVISDNDISGVTSTYIQVSSGTPVIRSSGGFATLTYGTTVATDASVAEHNKITVTDGVAFTISAPTHRDAGRVLTYEILNSSGGAMGAITWNAAFKLAGAFVNPANTFRRTISFYDNGSNLIEITRAAADI